MDTVFSEGYHLRVLMHSFHDKSMWGLNSFSCTYAQRMFTLNNMNTHEFVGGILPLKSSIIAAQMDLSFAIKYIKLSCPYKSLSGYFFSRQRSHIDLNQLSAV